MKVAQSCLTLCDSMDYMVHGILQARILEWVAFLFSRGIFPAQGSNPGLPHCRQILYQLSNKGSPVEKGQPKPAPSFSSEKPQISEMGRWGASTRWPLLSLEQFNSVFLNVGFSLKQVCVGLPW